MTFTVIDLEQGTAAWHRWRHDGIGASDAPALMGENPWRSPEYLFAEKVAPCRFGLPPRFGPPRQPAAIADLFPVPRTPDKPPRANGLEAHARALYAQQHGGVLLPLCLESTMRAWQHASLDGIDLAAGRALEIKCGPATYAETARTGRVPGHYIGQLQHTLAVTGYASIDFWVWLPGRVPLLITEWRDDVYIARLIERGTDFWQKVLAARQISCASRP